MGFGGHCGKGKVMMRRKGVLSDRLGLRRCGSHTSKLGTRGLMGVENERLKGERHWIVEKVKQKVKRKVMSPRRKQICKVRRKTFRIDLYGKAEVESGPANVFKDQTSRQHNGGKKGVQENEFKQGSGNLNNETMRIK